MWWCPIHHSFNCGYFYGCPGYGDPYRDPYDDYDDGSYRRHKRPRRRSHWFPPPPATPDLEELLSLLYYYTGPQPYNQIRQVFEQLQLPSRYGYDMDEQDSYYLAEQIEELSRYLQSISRSYYWAPGMRQLASDLKSLARSLQKRPFRHRAPGIPMRGFRVPRLTL